MGQKVNPVGMRVGINRNWSSRWFADKKNYATFLTEDIAVREYLTKELKDALISHIEIDRANTADSGFSVVVAVHVARPGVAIGTDGATINRVKKELEKMVKSGTLRIDIIEVKNPDLDANLVAQSIAKQLEERVSYRVAQKKTIVRVRKAGAKGIRTLVSGRLGGAEIARNEGYKEGVIPLHTLRSDIDYAQVEAHTTYGRLGVKVWICRGEIRPERKTKNTKGE
ncbi:MAG TPA: 30S ribosomal protein S3 [Bacilli bacterium]|jgi:small subunit ribosomal protein S3|nr:30S ribosomal protein S3 [Bacilli bacterium]MDD3388979.1 30S ribosomal protein S3 [Bacilli bacterium]MDD4344418.1 30S ribosomal protein S3 [Bacilli bacterium]MDD4520678.1 30S ribosomal protein S3 [Bacilli bacterium]HKM11507.1 30S ribosomal protein S3 [Bacilli bacterium]